MKISWSEGAKIDLKSIVIFFNQRNKSKKYSKKLVKEIKSTIFLLKKNNFWA